MSQVQILAKALGFVGIFAVAAISAVRAGETCPSAHLEPFPSHRPFLLNDPRSGLMLYLESDGRHMAAISHDGKIIWQRDLFADPKMESVYPPNVEIVGEPTISDQEWRRRMQAYVAGLRIDRIEVVSDCVANLLDHGMGSPLLRGHYIWAGSGTHIEYSLDANTGDLLVGPIN